MVQVPVGCWVTADGCSFKEEGFIVDLNTLSAVGLRKRFGGDAPTSIPLS